MAAKITTDTCEILITAEEAFRAFETAVLRAETRVDAGFRVFDFTTSLRSDEALAIGDTWFDLLAFKLDQGVDVSLKLTDFDPVVAGEMHAHTWRTIRQAAALREIVRHPERLTVRASMHGGRIGWLAAIGLWVKSRALVSKAAERYNSLDGRAKALFALERPGLRPLLEVDSTGTARAQRWPPARLVPATHHHKLAVIDRKTVYIGGLDLNDRRYDTKRHDRDNSETWHDVQVMVRDADLAQAAQAHLAEFDQITSGQTAPTELPKPFLRTLSAPRAAPVLSLSPSCRTRSIRQAHLDHIAAAQDLIYLETQFLRDRDITRALCNAARRRPDLGLVVVLPAAPEEVAFENAAGSDSRYGEYLQAKSLLRLHRAFGLRLFAGSPVQPIRRKSDDRSTLSNAPMLYVHAKVSVFDDTAAIVSSANLNGRSLNWDTEAGVEVTDSDLVKHLKQRCIGHWLPDRDLEPYLRGKNTVQAWHTHARLNAETAPDMRLSFIVPYKVGPARRFGRNLPGVPEEMV